MRFYRWLPVASHDASGQFSPNWSIELTELPTGIDWWDLDRGRYIQNWDPNVIATFSEDVKPTDFPFVDHLIPIYSPGLKALIERLGIERIQYLPLRLRGRESGREIGGYCIANYQSVIDCLDRERSIYRVLTKENLLFWEKRPWKLGTFDNVVKVVLEVEKIADARLFRLWGWSPMVIVREDVKQAIEDAGITGCRFTKMETT